MRLFFLISIIFAQSEIQHLNQAIYIRTTEKNMSNIILNIYIFWQLHCMLCQCITWIWDYSLSLFTQGLKIVYDGRDYHTVQITQNVIAWPWEHNMGLWK